jgi:signal transduction histidine kinase
MPVVRVLVFTGAALMILGQSWSLIANIPAFDELPVVGRNHSISQGPVRDAMLYCGAGILLASSYFAIIDAARTRASLAMESDRRLGMVAELERARSQLQTLNETLEARVQERTAIAEHRAEQLRALASQLTNAEQLERRRISQILHDHIQQLLVALKFKLAARESSPADEELDAEIRALLDQTLNDCRSLSVELSPPMLYDSGLGMTLQWLARQMKEKHGLTVHIEAADGSEPRADDLRVFLFQATRELLFNIVKHSGANEARIRMRCNGENELCISVEDDGAGFEVKELAGRQASNEAFGLFNIQERLDMVSGKLIINSAPGRGTRIKMYVPIAGKVVV